MIRVRSSNELFQRTGEGDAYVYKPLDVGPLMQAVQLRDNRVRHEDAKKAKAAGDLDEKLKYNPEAVRAQWQKYQDTDNVKLLDLKAKIAKKGVYDYNDPDVKEFETLKSNNKIRVKKADNIFEEIQGTHAAFTDDKYTNKAAAKDAISKAVYDDNFNSLRDVDGHNPGDVTKAVFGNPDTLDGEKMAQDFVKDLPLNVAKYSKTNEDGDVTTTDGTNISGKFLEFDKNGKPKMENGRPIIKVTDESLQALFATDQHGRGEAYFKNQYEKGIREGAVDPKSTDFKKFMANKLSQYGPTSVEKDDKTILDEDIPTYNRGTGYSDKNGSLGFSKNSPYNFDREVHHKDASGKITKSEKFINSGLGMDAKDISLKGGKSMNLPVSSPEIYDFNTGTKMDRENDKGINMIAEKVVYMPKLKGTNSPAYSLVERQKGESDDEFRHRTLAFVAKHSDKYELGQYLQGVQTNNYGTEGDEVAGQSDPNRKKKGDPTSKENKRVLVPYDHVKGAVRARFNPEKPKDFDEHMKYSEAQEELNDLIQAERSKPASDISEKAVSAFKAKYKRDPNPEELQKIKQKYK
jgi:hypothetical protein